MKIIKVSKADAEILKALLDGSVGSSDSLEFNKFAYRLLRQLKEFKGKYKLKNDL